MSQREGWLVNHDAIQLGFFSFSKLLMFMDLAPEAWPEGGLRSHPLTRGLLFEGFENEPASHHEGEQLDVILPPAKLLHVVDADASQARAIEEVRAGRSLVIQGPPGTGKSQTITNIIATAVKEGKTVLFMAEKMAALSVVYDRLVQVGLRDVCLELHSKNANKKHVVEELNRTLEAAQAAPPMPEPPHMLTAVRDRLNLITSALHAPIGGTGETALTTLARQARYFGMGVPPPALSSDQLATMDSEQERKLCDSIEQYGQLLQRIGSPNSHPLRGVRRLDIQPVELQRVAKRLDESATLSIMLSSQMESAAAALGVSLQAKIAGVAPLLAALGEMAGLAPGGNALAKTFMAATNKTRLVSALFAGLEWQQAYTAASERFLDGLTASSLAHLRASFVAACDSLLARWGPAYRSASTELAGHLRGPLPKMPAERLALVDELFHLQSLRKRWQDDEVYCSQSMGDSWCGERTNFGLASATAQWCKKLDDASLNIQIDGALSLASDPERVATLSAKLAGAAAPLDQALHDVFKVLDLDITTFGVAALDEIDLRVAAVRLKDMAGCCEAYQAWAQAAKLVNQLEGFGLGPLTARMNDGTLSGLQATAELRYARAERLWQEAREHTPLLQELDSMNRHQLVELFSRLEREHLRSNVSKILAGHSAQMPQGALGEMKIIRGEIGKRRRHLPLRELVSSAPNAMQRIKPVLFMSPISVAQYLPPGTLSFDLLVIDEASQVRPEDALGAVARARQIVVVGDPKQLPPTSFFSRLLLDGEDGQDGEDEEDAMHELLGGAAKLDELESILTLCDARGLSTRMLKWHYRSKDPSLIKVSNREFYSNQLILPPSPLQQDPRYGLCFTRIEGVYDRGDKRDNRIEGEAIVRRVAEHARAHPDLTLGVATFSAAQRNLISELLELGRRTDSVLNEFLREAKKENVFVKNIENIQGDERDVILISVCYGPSLPGGSLPSMSFGPVNSEGGERRLNVLFTRARLRCEVFASFDPEDIDLSRSHGEGLRIFKSYLDFAKSGKLQQAVATKADSESPLEEDIAEVVRSFGYLADPQVGSAGFRIDIGVRHPNRPGTYLLAVECDGATYHSALWARERDRLRQEVLEHLGWRFHRIWSTDWFYRRHAETERLHAALQAASEVPSKIEPVGRRDANNTAVVSIPLLVDERGPDREDTLGRHSQVVAYTRALFPVESAVEPHQAEAGLLSVLARRIVEAEGPIHAEEVARRIAASFGRDRAGHRILAAAREALSRASQASGDLLHDEQEFWFTRQQSEAPVVRDRALEEGATLKPENISVLEIRAALALARAENGGGLPSELVRAAARLLGFRRVGSELQSRIAQGL